MPGSRNLRIYTLSTNCVYYAVYTLLPHMAQALEQPGDPAWGTKAHNLKHAINRHFWDADRGNFRYFSDAWGGCDYQEGLGQSFAIFFGVADEAQTASIFQTQRLTTAGIPCLSKSFSRYDNLTGTDYGRQAGTVWPHIQGFWADAAARHGRSDLLGHELYKLTQHALRDAHFAEVYHPDSTLMYGGVQEGGRRWEWKSCRRQTWSATAYLRMLLFGVLGMHFAQDAITLDPLLPEGLTRVELKGLVWRGRLVNITVEGQGADLTTCEISSE